MIDIVNLRSLKSEYNLASLKVSFKMVTHENIGGTLSDTNHSKILYDPPPRIMEIKAKINKWDLSSVQSLSRVQLFVTP